MPLNPERTRTLRGKRNNNIKGNCIEKCSGKMGYSLFKNAFDFSMFMDIPIYARSLGQSYEKKGTFNLFDFFATCEYFEEKFNYDEVLELPPTQAGTGDGDGGVINIDEYETIQPDPLSFHIESCVGFDGMRIDRKFYDHFEETVKNDDTVREHYESGNIKAAEEYIRDNLFDKPEEFFNLDKLRKSVQIDHRFCFWE